MQAEPSDLAAPSAVVIRDHIAVRPVREATWETLQCGIPCRQIQQSDGAKSLQAESSDLAVRSAVFLRDQIVIRPVSEAALKSLQQGAGRLQPQELSCRENSEKIGCKARTLKRACTQHTHTDTQRVIISDIIVGISALARNGNLRERESHPQSELEVASVDLAM